MVMADKKLSFEKSFSELEKIVHELESDKIDLDEGLKKYERGLELAAACQKKLKEVENKVRLIKAKFGGEQKESEGSSDKDIA